MKHELKSYKDNFLSVNVKTVKWTAFCIGYTVVVIDRDHLLPSSSQKKEISSQEERMRKTRETERCRSKVSTPITRYNREGTILSGKLSLWD